MKYKKLYAVLLSLLSFFSTFANMSNTVFAQGVPKVQIAYCTDGIIYQGKYKFWIVASQNIQPLYVIVPFHLENGQIENIANIYPSSISIPIGVEDGNIEIIGQAVTSLTVSGSSPILTLDPGIDYAVTPVTHCEDLISAVLSATLVGIAADLKPVEEAQNEFNSLVENAPLVLQGTGFDFDILKQLTDLSYVAPLIIGGVVATREGIPSVVGTKHWWECVAKFNNIHQILQLPSDQWISELSKIGFTNEEIPVALKILEMTQHTEQSVANAAANAALLDNYHEATALSLANNAVNEVRQIVPQHVSADEFARELAAIDKRSGVTVLENVHVKPLVEETVQSAHEYVLNPTPENLQTYTNLAPQAARESIDDASQVALEMAQTEAISGQVQSEVSGLVSQSTSVTPITTLSQTFFLNNYYNLIDSTDTVSFVSIRGNTIWQLSPTPSTIPGFGEQGSFEYLAPRIAEAWANGQIDGIIPAAADIIDDATLNAWNLQLRGIITANYPDKLAEFDLIQGIIRKNLLFLYTTDASGLPIIKAVNTKTGEVIATPQIPEDYVSRMDQGAINIENKIDGLKTDGSFQQKLVGAEESAQQLGNEEALNGISGLSEALTSRPELSLQAVANAWKTEKISGVVKYLDSIFKGFAADYAGAIKTATRIFFVVYIVLTVALAFNLVPKEWVPLLMTVHSLLSWGFALFTFASVVWPAIVALATREGFIKAGGILVTGAIHVYLPMIVISMGMLYATWWLGSQCTGQIKVEPSKSTAQQGETIKLRISGFSGSGCPQKPIYLFDRDPNAQGVTPQIIKSSSNPAGIDLDFTLPATTGTYTYYVAVRIEPNRAYTTNELEAVNVNCPSSSQQCTISVGAAGQQPPSGGQQPSTGERPPITTEYCQLTADKTTITGRTKVKFTVTNIVTTLNGKNVIAVSPVCGNTLLDKVQVSNGNVEFECYFKAFGSQTSITSYVSLVTEPPVPTATETGTIVNAGCQVQITANPDATAGEVIAEQYTKTQLPSDVIYSRTTDNNVQTITVYRVGSSGLVSSYVQGANVYITTDYLYLGEGRTDYKGEVTYTPPYSTYDVVNNPHIWIKLPTQEEVEQLKPQITNIEGNDQTYLNIIGGVEEHSSFSSPVTLTFETNIESNCFLTIAGIPGGGQLPNEFYDANRNVKSRLDFTSSDHKHHSVTLTFSSTGSTFPFTLVCTPLDTTLLPKEMNIPSFVVTSLPLPDVAATISITRVNVNGCEILPTQACAGLGWGAAGSAVIHGNGQTYIEAVTSRRGVGPFFVQFINSNTGQVLSEIDLPNPTFVYAAGSPAEEEAVGTTITFPVGVNYVKIAVGHVANSQKVIDNSVSITLNADNLFSTCSSGTTRCSGNTIQKCDVVNNQLTWINDKTCQFGCAYENYGAYCKDQAGATGSCYLGTNPSSIQTGQSSTITVAYSGLSSAPGEVTVNCGNGQTATATCQGTSGTCSAVCSYPISSLPAKSSYTVSATASGIVCDTAEVSFTGEVVGQPEQGIYLKLGVNQNLEAWPINKVGDTAPIFVQACKDTACFGLIQGLTVTLYLNGNIKSTRTTDSTGSTFWQEDFPSAGTYTFYAKFGDVQSNSLTFNIQGSTETSSQSTIIQATGSQSISPQSPVQYGVTTIFTFRYLTPDFNPISGATCVVNIDGTDYTASYDSSSNYVFSKVLDVGTHAWYFTCSKTGYATQTFPSEQYVVNPATQDEGGTGAPSTTFTPCDSGYICYGTNSYDCIAYCGNDENVEAAKTVTTPCNEAGNKACCKCTTLPAGQTGGAGTGTTQPSITLSASPTSIYVNGISTVTATTSDSKPSITISFTSTLTGLSATTCITDSTGKCSVTFTSSELGTATITASATGYSSKSIYISIKTPSGGLQPSGFFESFWQILKSIFGIK